MYEFNLSNIQDCLQEIFADDIIEIKFIISGFYEDDLVIESDNPFELN